MATVLACLLSGAAVAVALVSQGSTSAQVARLSREDTSLRQGLAALQQRESAVEGQLSTLTIPDDPLSAYNQLCSTTATGEESGVTSTYWYPCTDQAQTIPQPGA